MEYLDKIFDIINSQYTDAHIIILVNDKHYIPFSIKDDEYDRSTATYCFPKSLKIYSQQMLSSKSDDEARKHGQTAEPCHKPDENTLGLIIVTEKEQTTRNSDLATGDYGIQQIHISALILCKAGEWTPHQRNVLDSEDIDVLCQGSLVSYKIRDDLVIKRKEKRITYPATLPDVVDVIIPHVITGYDYVFPEAYEPSWPHQLLVCICLLERAHFNYLKYVYNT